MRKWQVTTVTPNPALDRTYWLEEFQPGRQYRAGRGKVDPGGKGINIARVLQGYGLEVAALGFFAGLSGQELLRLLAAEEIKTQPVLVEGETRTNTKIIDPAGQTLTEINEPGPSVGEGEIDQFQWYVADYAANSRYMIFAGSLPRNCPPDFYGRLIRTAKQSGCRTLLDTSGAALAEGSKAVPYLIKPNQQELAGLCGREIGTAPAAVAAAAEVRKAYGVEAVVVSLGAQGAVLVEQKGAYLAVPPEVKVKNPVGAGDSLVAGLVYGLLAGYSLPESLRLGVADGTMAVLDEATSMAKPRVETALAFWKEVELKRLS